MTATADELQVLCDDGLSGDLALTDSAPQEANQAGWNEADATV